MNTKFSLRFVAHNLKRVPCIDPSSVDLAFMLASVENLRKKVDALLDLRKEGCALQASVTSLASSAMQKAATSQFQ